MDEATAHARAGDQPASDQVSPRHASTTRTQASKGSKGGGVKEIRIWDQKWEFAPVLALRPHPQNPRTGDVAAIRASLDVNGWYGAIVAQRSTGFILAGNHRYKAACQ